MNTNYDNFASFNINQYQNHNLFRLCKIPEIKKKSKFLQQPINSANNNLLNPKRILLPNNTILLEHQTTINSMNQKNSLIFNPFSYISYIDLNPLRDMNSNTTGRENIQDFQLFVEKQNLLASDNILKNLQLQSLIDQPKCISKKNDEQCTQYLTRSNSTHGCIVESTSPSTEEVLHSNSSEEEKQNNIDNSSNTFLNRQRKRSEEKPQKPQIENDLNHKLNSYMNGRINYQELSKRKYIESGQAENISPDKNYTKTDIIANLMEKYFSYSNNSPKKYQTNSNFSRAHLAATIPIKDMSIQFNTPLEWKETKNICTKFPRKLWKPPPEPPSALKLLNFLDTIENNWPHEKYPYSQELTLEFLMINSYNYETVTKSIKNFDKKFEEFLKSKMNNTVEFQIDLKKKKSKYLLRKNK